MEKRCRICGEVKPIDAYSKRPHTSRNDGRRTDCKACVVARTSGRDRSDYNRAYRTENADRLRQYRVDHPQPPRPDYFRAYRLANPDAARAIASRYNASHKVERTIRAHDRRAVPMDHQAREWVRQLLAGTCSYCCEPAVTVDHIVPLSAGGSNDWWNLTGACKSCNSSKGTRSLLAFMLAA